MCLHNSFQANSLGDQLIISEKQDDDLIPKQFNAGSVLLYLISINKFSNRSQLPTKELCK